MTMKNLKNLVPVFAIVLGLGLVVTQSAFKPTTDTVWVFDGASLADVEDADFYHVELEEEPTCDEGTTRPCKIVSIGSSSTDKNDFQDYLDITFDSPQEIVDGALTKRD
jgi:hypothetical protein